MHHSCVVISITNGSETLTFWHCFEDTSRVLLRFKLTPKLYHPNFLRNKKQNTSSMQKTRKTHSKKLLPVKSVGLSPWQKNTYFLEYYQSCRLLWILCLLQPIWLPEKFLLLFSIGYLLLPLSVNQSYFQRHPPSISVGAKGWGKYKLPASFSNYAHPSKVCWGRGSHSWVKGQINFLGSICNHDKTLAKFLELEANSAHKAMYIWKPISSKALPCGLMQVETYCWPWYFLWW